MRDAIDTSIRSRIQYEIIYRTVHPDTGDVKWIRALTQMTQPPLQFDGVMSTSQGQKLDQQHLPAINQELRQHDRGKDEIIATYPIMRRL